jgi:hypothetical protein
MTSVEMATGSTIYRSRRDCVYGDAFIRVFEQWACGFPQPSRDVVLVARLAWGLSGSITSLPFIKWEFLVSTISI